MFVKSISVGPGLVCNNYSMGYPSVNGLMYWSNTDGGVKVVDPSGQTQGGSYAIPPQVMNLELSAEVQDVIQWAQVKMAEEKRLQQLMLQHPGLKDAHEKFEIMKALVSNAK